jgi:hypothetical protein
MTPSLHEESRFVARRTSLSLPLFSKVSESSERVSGHVCVCVMVPARGLLFLRFSN